MTVSYIKLHLNIDNYFLFFTDDSFCLKIFALPSTEQAGKGPKHCSSKRMTPAPADVQPPTTSRTDVAPCKAPHSFIEQM